MVHIFIFQESCLKFRSGEIDEKVWYKLSEVILSLYFLYFFLDFSSLKGAEYCSSHNDILKKNFGQFVLNSLLGPVTSFYRKSKINIKRKPNYEIGWFHNWPMIISHRLYAFHFTNEVFRYNCKSDDVFYSPNSL